MSDIKPLVLIGCTPIYGHLVPLRAIAKQLVDRGYEVTFVSASHYQKMFEEVGCTYVPFEGYADYWEGDIPIRWPVRATLPPGPVQMSYELEHWFYRAIPGQHEALQKAMKMLTERYPARPIVQLCEGFCQGGVPISLGAPGLKPTGTLGIGVIPMTLDSIDTAPFGPGLPPPTTPEEHAQYQGMREQISQGPFRKAQEVWVELLLGLGATPPNYFALDAAYLAPDRFLQMCIPSVEYPRSDAPPTIFFSGGLAKDSKATATPSILPSFWHEITSNATSLKPKKIVAVCQGTLALDYGDLTLPLIRALANRDDILLVVALGKRGGELPKGTVIPSNTRVADYIPFDDLLPHCDVFVTNGGYGGFQHAISNGTPLVCAGATEDKPEVGARAEWCGMAVNLKTGKPTEEALIAGVDEILGNSKYKTRALELQAETKLFDPISLVARNIDELGRGEKLV